LLPKIINQLFKMSYMTCQRRPSLKMARENLSLWSVSAFTVLVKKVSLHATGASMAGEENFAIFLSKTQRTLTSIIPRKMILTLKYSAQTLNVVKIESHRPIKVPILVLALTLVQKWAVDTAITKMTINLDQVLKLQNHTAQPWIALLTQMLSALAGLVAIHQHLQLVQNLNPGMNGSRT